MMQGEKFVDVNGIRTRYFEGGDGEPLFLVHGGTIGQFDNVDCAENWELNWDGFTRNYHVFAYDKLGQGYTDNPRTDDEWTMQATVRHAYEFLETLGLRGVHLVGHSRGGYVVTRLALEHPELVRTTTIIDSSTTAPGANLSRGPLLAGAPKPLLSRESLRWVADAFSASSMVTESWLDARERIAKTEKNQAAVSTMKRLAESGYLAKLDEQKEETLAWIKEGRLKSPTLLVWGFNDPSALVSGGYALFEIVASGTPRSQLHVFNRAGHYSYREHPGDFVRVVTSFIQGS